MPTLSTYLLYAERDLEYYVDLEAHLMLMLEKYKLGSLRGFKLSAFNVRDRGLDRLTEVPTCLVCVLTPHFIKAIRSERYLWSELARLHADRRLLILPVLAEDCTAYHAVNLLRQVPCPGGQREPLSIWKTGGDYSTKVAQLVKSCQTAMEQALHYHKVTEKHWEYACHNNTIDGYEYFEEQFGKSKYGPEATRRRAELLEKELWASAQAFDTTKHYLYYLHNAPLETYRDEAVDRIIAIEMDQTINEEDVKSNGGIGLGFDYKSRFRAKMDYEMVEDLLDDVLGEPVRLDEKRAWPKMKAQYLKRQVYKKCSKAEALLYSQCEEYAKRLRGLNGGVRVTLLKKLQTLVSWRWTLVVVFGAVAYIDWLANLGISQILIEWIEYRYVLAPALLLGLNVLFYNAVYCLNRELQTCMEIQKHLLRELIHLQVAFIIKTEYGQCLRELHNMEEWGVVVKDKPMLSYAFADEEEMEFHAHTLRKMEVPKMRKAI